MNNARRKNLESIHNKIEKIIEGIGEYKQEEEDYKDNMPENLQGSEKREKAESACDELDECIERLEEAISNIACATE